MQRPTKHRPKKKVSFKLPHEVINDEELDDRLDDVLKAIFFLIPALAIQFAFLAIQKILDLILDLFLTILNSKFIDNALSVWRYMKYTVGLYTFRQAILDNDNLVVNFILKLYPKFNINELTVSTRHHQIVLNLLNNGYLNGHSLSLLVFFPYLHLALYLKRTSIANQLIKHGADLTLSLNKLFPKVDINNLETVLRGAKHAQLFWNLTPLHMLAGRIKDTEEKLLDPSLIEEENLYLTKTLRDYSAILKSVESQSESSIEGLGVTSTKAIVFCDKDKHAVAAITGTATGVKPTLRTTP